MGNLPLPNKINSSVLPLLFSPDSSVVSCPENNRSNSVDSFLPDSVLSQESSTVLVVSSKPPESRKCLVVNLSTLWPTSIDNKMRDGVTSSVLDLDLPQESSTVPLTSSVLPEAENKNKDQAVLSSTMVTSESKMS